MASFVPPVQNKQVHFQSEPNSVSKRKRNWYANNVKKRKHNVLETGMKGFLCTCNFQEKNCVRDAYKLLTEFSDKAEEEMKKDQAPPSDESQVSPPPENQASPPKELKNSDIEMKVEDPQVEVQHHQLEIEESDDEDEDNEDISTALSKEVNQLKAEDDTIGRQRKFNAIETSVKNTLFIQSTVPDPLKLAMSIIKEVYETKKQRSKYILRFLPIEIVTKAKLDDLKSKANIVLEKYFSQEPKTYSIIFNRHSNSNLQRNDVIDELGSIIMNKNPGNKANLKNPEIAVVVEVIRGFCLLSIAPNYIMYKKYNIMEMCKPSAMQQKKDSTDSTGSKSMNDLTDVENSDVAQMKDDVNSLS